MQGLSFSILIMPVLAISLDVLLFVTLLRKVARKSIFKQYILAVILFSFLLNAVWEILQIPLYKRVFILLIIFFFVCWLQQTM